MAMLQKTDHTPNFRLPTHSSPTRGPTHRWKVLAIGFIANASFAAAISGIPTTAVFMRSGYRIGNAELGLAFGAIGVGLVASELPWGMITDRWGDRKVLLTGLGLTGLVELLMACFAAPTPGYTPPVALLTAGMLLIGLAGGSLNGSSGRAVMAWFSAHERGLAMSIRQTALPAGGALGALILPPIVAAAGFQWAFGALALLCGLSGALAWHWLHEPLAENAAPSRKDHVSKAAHGPLGDPVIWRISTGIGALCIPQVAILTFAVIFLHDFAQLGTVATSASLIVVQIGAAVMRVAIGYWSDRSGSRRAILRGCSLFVVAIFVGVAGLVTTETLEPRLLPVLTIPIMLAIIIGGIVSSCWHGIAFTELATVAGPNRVGTALGLGNTFAFVSLVIAPMAIPLILEASSWAWVWAAIAVTALAAWPLFPKPAK